MNNSDVCKEIGSAYAKCPFGCSIEDCQFDCRECPIFQTVKARTQETIVLANLVDANRTVAIPASKIIDVQETKDGCFISLKKYRRVSVGYAVVESLDKILNQLKG